jgi:type I restriction enzyme S subunit
VQFLLPPTIDEQIAMANELDRRMNTIEKIKPAALDQKAAIFAIHGAILREIFPRKEGDKLPQEWKWEKSSRVCFINPRVDRSVPRDENTGTSFIPMEAIDEIKGKIAKIITRKYSEISKGYTFFKEGDVLFAKITPCMQNGKSAIAENLSDGIGFGSTEFHVLRPKEGIIKEWIYYFVRTPEFRKRAEERFEGSAGQQRVPNDFMEESLIPLPQRTEDQIKIVSDLKLKMNQLERMNQAIDKKIEASEALQRAVLREVFDFEPERTEKWQRVKTVMAK